MNSPQINILLELNDAKEWCFTIVSMKELSLMIVKGDKKLTKLTEKSSTEGYKLKNIETINLKIFMVEEKSVNTEKTHDFETVLVPEVKTELCEENTNLLDPCVKLNPVYFLKDPVKIIPFERSVTVGPSIRTSIFNTSQLISNIKNNRDVTIKKVVSPNGPGYVVKNQVKLVKTSKRSNENSEFNVQSSNNSVDERLQRLPSCISVKTSKTVLNESQLKKVNQSLCEDSNKFFKISNTDDIKLSYKADRNKPINNDFLPKNLQIPDISGLEPPFTIQSKQPDGSCTYFHKNVENGKFYVTNFDLFSLQCELCEEKFESYILFICHIRDTHLFPLRISKCAGCSGIFNGLKDKFLHSFYCVGIKKVKKSFCYICNTQLKGFVALKEHLKSHELKPIRKKQENKFECDHCGAKYPNRARLLKHLITKHFTHMATYECNVCNPTMSFSSYKEYFEHRNIHKARKPPKSIINFDTFAERQKCHQCDRFIIKKIFDEHMKTHSTKKNIKTDDFLPCEICGKAFITLQGLVGHKKSHIPEVEREFKCQFCSKGFNNHFHLIEHERLHTGEKPFECHYCEKKYAKRQTFTDHMRTHTGNGYKCDHCDKMLWDHSSYRKHLKIHEDKLGIKLTYNKEERRLKYIGISKVLQKE